MLKITVEAAGMHTAKDISTKITGLISPLEYHLLFAAAKRVDGRRSIELQFAPTTKA